MHSRTWKRLFGILAAVAPATGLAWGQTAAPGVGNAIVVTDGQDQAGGGTGFGIYPTTMSGGYGLGNVNSGGTVWIDDAAQAAHAAAVTNSGHEHGGGCCAEAPCGDSCCEKCCDPVWWHRCGVFGEFMYLSARDVDMVYALPVDGIDPANSVPVGPVGVADPDYEPGYRIGGSWAFDTCASIVGTFSWYESHTEDAIQTAAPNVIRSLVTLPGTASAAADSLVATASYDIDFITGDIVYRRVLSASSRGALNYQIGARIGHLEQDFRSTQPISPGSTSVTTEIDFDGGGPRFGLDGIREVGRRGFNVYANGFANFLAGQFQADYQQFNTFAQQQGITAWEDDRIVPILETELGFGWTGCRGHVRVSGGYYMAAWYNTLTTGTLIQAVQNSNYVDVGETLTFDGVVARIELRR